MDLEKAKLEELLLILEIKRLGIATPDHFENVWTDQEIYQKIADYYLSYTGTSSQNFEQLYEWLKEKARYPLLNALLKTRIYGFMQVGHIKDNFVLSNFKSLVDIMMQIFQVGAEASIYVPASLSKLDRATAHQFVQEFLMEVDPSLQWLNIYNEMLQNNKMIIFNDLNDSEQKKMRERTYGDGTTNICIHSEEVPFIVVTLNENIADFISIIHEFAHYISYYHNPQAQICGTLLESSSIFYEYYALLFLEKKGYSKEEIETIRKDRLANIFELSLQINNICNYLHKYLETGEIKEEQELLEAANNTNTALEVLPDEVKKSLLKVDAEIFNPKVAVYNRCDNCIEQMIAHPEYLYQCYPYIIGNYLAMMGMEQIQLGNNILPKIKELTETLYSINPLTFFETVGCLTDRVKTLKPNL